MIHTSEQSDSKPLAAIILAAGKGTRMNSDLPKVLHRVSGKPMVAWVVEACRAAGADRIVLVVGHGADLVKNQIAGCEFVLQEPQLGTGHAVLVCKETFTDFNGDILVLGGDGPLLQTSTIETMMTLHQNTGAPCTLATSTITDPTGYGRILRDSIGKFEAIIEHKNASPEQLEIREVYPSYAVFDAIALWNSLERLAPNELTNEYYITEIPRMMREEGLNIEIVNTVAPDDILSINTPEQLAEVESIINARYANKVEPTS